MLLRFRVENFRSLRDEQEFSLVASNLDDHTSGLMEVPGGDVRALPVAAIYGANASGKSGLFHALRFTRDAVVHSHRSWNPEGGVPRQPFLLDAQSASKPTTVDLSFVTDGVRYEYGFTVDSERVLEEWLYAYPNGRAQKWLIRDISAKNEYRFSRELQGENAIIRKLTRSNSLFLSAAAQNNHGMLRPVYDWFATKLVFFADADRFIAEAQSLRMAADQKHRGAIERLLRVADLGIVGMEIGSEVMPESALKVAEALVDDPDFKAKLRASPSIPRVRLRHAGKSSELGVELPFEAESRGTRALFGLAGVLVSSLASGAVLCVDELDSSLHPLLGLEIVRLFNEPKANAQSSQLIFNTHDTNLLDCRVLRRDQIWFTEKDNEGATHLYPLTDFHARKDENFERGYLQGRYGAIPFVSWGGELISDVVANG